jgi:hypothetical protein
MAKDTETERGKDSIIPPPPEKSFLDRASNRLSRTIAQIQTGHWLCAPYLKRIRKDREEQVSDKCWWCGRSRMSRTHVFLHCMHPQLENARIEIWERPDEDWNFGCLFFLVVWFMLCFVIRFDHALFLRFCLHSHIG